MSGLGSLLFTMEVQRSRPHGVIQTYLVATHVGRLGNTRSLPDMKVSDKVVVILQASIVRAFSKVSWREVPRRVSEPPTKSSPITRQVKPFNSFR